MTRYLSLKPNVGEVSIPCVQCYRSSRKFVSCIEEDVSQHLLTQNTFTPAGLNNLHLEILKEPAGEQLVLLCFTNLEKVEKFPRSGELAPKLGSSESWKV